MRTMMIPFAPLNPHIKKEKSMRSACALVTLLFLAGCATQQTETSATVQCTAPRAQVCTMEYAPTCAELIAGGNKEYSSPCNACADDGVAGYVAGPCPE
jgi:hypothetical protein